MSEPNTIGIKKNWWLKPPEPYVYINHSCEPNVGIIGTVTFKALRKIHKDEELFFDYSICEEGDWEMKCKCGSVNCRKIIGSVKTLPRKTFKKYLPFIPRYFQLVYQRQYKLV